MAINRIEAAIKLCSWVVHPLHAIDFPVDGQRVIELLPNPGAPTPPLDAGTRCLVVDGTVASAQSLADVLRHEGYAVRSVTTGEEALDVARTWKPAVVLLEWELAGIHGPRTAELLAGICDPFVIMVTSRNSEIDRVTSLSTIADDYITKPYSQPELLSRVRAMLRRERACPPKPAARTRFTVGALMLDTVMRTATFEGAPVDFTRLEFDILACLLSQAPRPVARKVLIREAWGEATGATTHTLDVHTSRLRHKLLTSGAGRTVAIESVRGFGLRLTVLSGDEIDAGTSADRA